MYHEQIFYTHGEMALPSVRICLFGRALSGRFYVRTVPGHNGESRQLPASMDSPRPEHAGYDCLRNIGRAVAQGGTMEYRRS